MGNSYHEIHILISIWEISSTDDVMNKLLVDAGRLTENNNEITNRNVDTYISRSAVVLTINTPLVG